MRSLIALGAVASLLTVAACNQPDETPTESEAAAAADAATADAASTPPPASGARTGAAASTDMATPYPTNDPMPPAMDAPAGDSPVSDATRAGAKEKAESTNLHPRTP
ncbi:MAG: hypothetical protein KF910_00095 [Brevundimonas sp.]|uniref:hypothetical protein n=1 Tax=Brevundimonas sp. TaxID=1871086 RepID=UPI0025C3C1A0|nr:hypothetical protein [Brevundimonas sp.]MBX3475988.1 hypothetical protein [Brevundimonas sp.]